VKGKKQQPLEYSLVMTATLCLLAFGTVMVYSASSATSLLGSSGDPAFYLKRTLLFGGVGLLVMRFLSLRGVAALRRMTPGLMVAAFVMLVAVLSPGIGLQINGARRWIGTGLVQIQPSEIAKLALVLYGAHLLASRPASVRSIGEMCRPLLGITGAICVLVVMEPDLGTAIVIAFTITALLVAAGAKLRHLAMIAGVLLGLGLIVILAEPYRRARLLGFLHPSANPQGAGFQSQQAQIALGSGGIFGVGIGESVQKVFYLPEAHTDMILAVIGEELGILGIAGLVGLFAMLAYGGFRTAKGAKDRYSKLLAAGLTSMILSQAALNFFAVLGMAPLTGVPLPFVSYGNSNLMVMMAAIGLLLNIARTGTARARKPATGAAGRLRVLDGGAHPVAKSRHSGGRNGGTRRTGTRGRRRAAG
jgi:cell division protein FtsW